MRYPPARPTRATLARSARRFLRRLALRGCELSIVVVGDAAIRRLNRQWRDKDTATDVLGFPAGSLATGPKLLGDVVISYQTAERRAKALGEPIQSELDRYLAHGLLHLLGYDHGTKSEALRMAAREEQLLGRKGMVAG